MIWLWKNTLPAQEQWSWPKHLSLFTSAMLLLALIQHAGAFYFRHVKSWNRFVKSKFAFFCTPLCEYKCNYVFYFCFGALNEWKCQCSGFGMNQQRFIIWLVSGLIKKWNTSTFELLFREWIVASSLPLCTSAFIAQVYFIRRHDYFLDWMEIKKKNPLLCLQEKTSIITMTHVMEIIYSLSFPAGFPPGAMSNERQ